MCVRACVCVRVYVRHGVDRGKVNKFKGVIGPYLIGTAFILDSVFLSFFCIENLLKY